MDQNKNIKHTEAIAKDSINHNNKEDNTMKNSQPAAQKPSHLHTFGSKAKMAFTNVANSKFVKNASTAILNWIDELPNALGRGCLRGLIIGIALNIIASYFWPELPETIPTIYEFFNGFVTFTEFMYKAALGGIAALFSGNFMEFGNTMMVELGELWNAFTAWISAISF